MKTNALGEEGTPVGSVCEYVEWVDAMAERWASTGCRRMWFRGQEEAAFGLSPTAYRYDTFDESSAFDVFWAQARGLSEFRHLNPDHYWDWYMAARHNGLPTRLLDWSTNALVALYFATKTATSGTRARVWVLNPIRMNEAFTGTPVVYIPEDRLRERDGLHCWLPTLTGSDCERKAYPVAIYPSSTNARLVAQQGMFTVHGTERKALDEQIAAEGNPECFLSHVDVGKDSSVTIQKQLSQLGLNDFTVMACGDALARHLTQFYGEPSC